MLPHDLKGLTLIPACDVHRAPESVPDEAGVYLFLLKGGQRILRATSYFETDDCLPLCICDHDHLYTGAASSLRDRLEQHMRRDMRSSSLRKTLLAIERQRRAVTGDHRKRGIVSESSLTNWMCRNAMIGIQFTSTPFDRERELIEHYTSPFNITLRRRHPYSKALMMWRSATFPPWRPQKRDALHIAEKNTAK